jgi:putative flippase GtrA
MRRRSGRRIQQVRSIQELYQRFRQVIHEGAKFLVVGLIGAIITFGIAIPLHHSVGEYGAITIATILATVVTYLGNGYWAFRSRQGQSTARDSVVFFVLNGIGLLIYYLCIWLFKDVAGLTGTLWYTFELVLGTGLGTLFRFWSYRKWVWVAVDTGRPSGTEALAEAIGEAPPSELTEQPRPAGPRHRAPATRR